MQYNVLNGLAATAVFCSLTYPGVLTMSSTVAVTTCKLSSLLLRFFYSQVCVANPTTTKGTYTNEGNPALTRTVNSGGAGSLLHLWKEGFEMLCWAQSTCHEFSILLLSACGPTPISHNGLGMECCMNTLARKSLLYVDSNS